MEKKPWNYSGKNQKGFQLSGTVFAASLEDAQTQIKNMGISAAQVLDPMETINKPAGIQVPVMLTVGGGFSGTTVGMGAELGAQFGVAPGAGGFIPPPSIPWQPDHMKPTAEEKNMNDMLRGLNKTVHEQIESTIEPDRRQTLFIGKQIEVLGPINDLLAKKNGKVISVQMRAGHDGYMMYAIVVEHEIKG